MQVQYQESASGHKINYAAQKLPQIITAAQGIPFTSGLEMSNSSVASVLVRSYLHTLAMLSNNINTRLKT